MLLLLYVVVLVALYTDVVVSLASGDVILFFIGLLVDAAAFEFFFIYSISAKFAGISSIVVL